MNVGYIHIVVIPFKTKTAVQSEAVTHSKRHLIAHNYRYKCCAHSVGLLQNIKRRACLLLQIEFVLKFQPRWSSLDHVELRYPLYIYSVSKLFFFY